MIKLAACVAAPFAAIAALVLVLPATAQDQGGPPVPFTETFMEDPENIAAGEALWAAQCRHCHGAKAYPGKAPKLSPRRYSPEFVYHRVTYGFRKMPAWEKVYTDEERMQITAYILSDRFSP